MNLAAVLFANPVAKLAPMSSIASFEVPPLDRNAVAALVAHWEGFAGVC